MDRKLYACIASRTSRSDKRRCLLPWHPLPVPVKQGLAREGHGTASCRPSPLRKTMRRPPRRARLEALSAFRSSLATRFHRTARGARCGACRSLRQLDDHLAGVRSRQQPIHRWDHVFQALNQVCGLQTAPADPAMENFRTKNNSVRSGLLLTFQGCQVLKTPRLQDSGARVNLFWKPIVILAQAGIQICTTDQNACKTFLMNELDSGSSPE
jgi:hypothetical protein